MHDFEVEEVEVFDDEDLEELFWLNRVVPKKMKEKRYSVSRKRPKEIEYEF